MTTTPAPAVSARAQTAASLPAAVATDRSVGFRRRASAISMVVGAAGPLVANTAYAWATRQGGDEDTAADTMALYAGHASAVRVATAAVVVGVLFLVPGLLGALRLARPAMPRLALTAVVLMIGGYIAYVWMNGSNLVSMALGQHTSDTTVAALDAAQALPDGGPFFVLFVVGNLLGTLLLAIAVLRSPGLPKAAGIGLLAWPVLHVTGLVVGSEWFEVTGAALQLVGLALLAAVALRLRDAEWVARG